MAPRSVSHSRVHLHRERLNSSTDLARRLLDLKSLAMNLEGFQLGSDDRDHHPALVSTREAVQRLASAKLAAESLQVPLRVFGCTDARMAAAVSTDADRRDIKFLTGSRTREGFHTYCGGLDAAISRGLVFAQHADVVCFRSNGADLFEAARFAAVLKSRFPATSLAYGHNATQNGLRWNELDHRVFAEKLRKLGYDIYFVTQFGQTTVPYTPISGAWVLLNDTVRGKSQIPGDLRRQSLSTLPLSPGAVSSPSVRLGA
jgi:isocitrate lyase